MSNLRRYHKDGNWYFITNVTYKRMPVLIEHIDLLRTAIERAHTRTEFDLYSWVILPDHFHMIIDTRQSHISSILQRIKMSFSFHWRVRTGAKSGRVWQNRFWDHIIRDDKDLEFHCKYIHFNPVKHGLVESTFDWPHSTIRKFHADEVWVADFVASLNKLTEGEFGE